MQEYLLVSPPILNTFLNHGCSNNYNQWNDGTGRGIGSQRRETQDTSHEEVKISHSPKLLEQRLWQESCRSILSCPNIICRIFPKTGVQTIRFIAINHSRETWSPNLWLCVIIFCWWSPCTFESIDPAEIYFPSSAVSHSAFFTASISSDPRRGNNLGLLVWISSKLPSDNAGFQGQLLLSNT